LKRGQKGACDRTERKRKKKKWGRVTAQKGKRRSCPKRGVPPKKVAKSWENAGQQKVKLKVITEGKKKKKKEVAGPILSNSMA